MLATTGGPNVMLGTKCPSLDAVSVEMSLQTSKADSIAHIMSTCSQSAPCPMVCEHAVPSSAKLAERMDGAMIDLGAIVSTNNSVIGSFTRSRNTLYKSTGSIKALRVEVMSCNTLGC
jgi:hypothetical protein